MSFFKKYSKWASVFILGAALIAVYKTFDSFHVVTSAVSMIFKAAMPFIIAFIIAYLLNIPLKKIESLIKKRIKNIFIIKHSYAISIAVVYVLFIVIVIVVLSALLPSLFKSLIDMIQHLPAYAEIFFNYINNLEASRKIGIHFNVDIIEESFRRFIGSIDTKTLSKFAHGGFTSVTSGIATVASSAISVFIAIIASIYMLIDKDRIIRGFKRVLRSMSKSSKVESGLMQLARINQIFTQYIYSRLICCTIMAVVCTVLLAILGEKYALLLGIFIGIMDMIPYFGSIIATAASAVITAISGGALHAVWCTIVLLVMQQIDGNVIAPRVMGSRLDIRPLTIIIAVSVGGSLFGFVGMLISVPVVAIARLTLVEYIHAREKRQMSEQNIDEPEANEAMDEAGQV
ncbi:MAG: AI-2E family transporter [Clostridia bacterium]|nr:AI-2E family transporter [Clostridia bacterium]